jgi:PAS domain S-box-containing protein
VTPASFQAAGPILIVEDDIQTAELERRALVRAGKRVRTVGRVAQALEAMREESFAAILLDYRLPDGEPWPVLEAARRALPPIPVILVTAMGDERLAAEVLHRGGADYLIKAAGFWEQLTGAVERVQKVARIEQTNARLAALVESSDDAIFSQSLAGRILSWNAGAERMFGYAEAEVAGQPVSLLSPPDHAAEDAAIAAGILRGEATRQLETTRVRRDGSIVEVSLTVTPVLDSSGQVVSAASISRDITARKRTERRLEIRNAVTRAIAGSAALADAGPPLLRAFCEGLGWELGALWTLEPGGQTLRCAGHWHQPGEALAALAASWHDVARRRADFPDDATASSGVLFVPDLDQAPAGDLHRAAAAWGQGCALVIPITGRSELRGFIELLGSRRPRFEEQQSSWLTAIASQVGQFLEECMANDLLRESERWLRLALEAAGMGVWDLDLTSGESTRSLRHDQIFGYQTLQPRWSTEILVRHVLTEDRPRAEESFRRALEAGDLRLECRVRWPDESIHWIALEGQVLRDAQARPVRMIGVITEVTARKVAEEALRQSAELDRALFLGSPLPMLLYDIDSLRILSVNEAAVRQYGYERRELLAMTLHDISSAEDPPPLATAQDEGPDYRRAGIFRHRKKDGSIVRVEIHVHDVWVGGRRSRLALLQDVTEHQKLEEQLRQSVKMEAIGRLAGGIAHDFNNLLTIVNGYSDHLLASSAPGREGYEELSEIRKAGEQAASLTRQLLAFSRPREGVATIVDLNSVVGDMDKLLRRLIGEHIALVLGRSPVLGNVRTDPGQIEQVVMNLAVNARDAMTGGGTLTIETANVEVDEVFARSHVDVVPGSYVMLTVTDTGCGMDDQTLPRIFEPFFTTKGPGYGTGLGLATVFGIVKQSAGHIYVYSEVGRGSTFKIYLPRVDAPPSQQPAEVAAGGLLAHGETVLVVEDQDQVRRLTCHVLRQAGYTVLEASTPEAALSIVREQAAEVDLVVTDVVMPEMDGPTLVREIAQLRPGLKTLFFSGYTGRTVTWIGRLDQEAPFLEKPFTPHALLSKVRQVLAAE